MLRNLIGNNGTAEIYVVKDAVKRGMIVTKDVATKKAVLANGEASDIYLVDWDYQPEGAFSDVDVSDYSEGADNHKADERATLHPMIIGEVWGLDQIKKDVTFVAGDYLMTENGLAVKAETGKISVMRYVEPYDDAGHKLQAFEIVMPHTVA